MTHRAVGCIHHLFRCNSSKISLLINDDCVPRSLFLGAACQLCIAIVASIFDGIILVVGFYQKIR
uniref:Uncharacterized protein n=1 Tax=Romanomermis culicivorax TaxID=13658 RepID=A0A915I6L7_ROMCU